MSAALSNLQKNRCSKLSSLQHSIYVQDPCTLRNVLKSQQAVYGLLKKIPDVDVQALPGNSQCCGGAGAHTVSQPEIAEKLLHDKLDAILDNDVAILATSNIGYGLHIAQDLRARHSYVEVIHPIQIIARQMGWPENFKA